MTENKKIAVEATMSVSAQEWSVQQTQKIIR